MNAMCCDGVVYERSCGGGGGGGFIDRTATGSSQNGADSVVRSFPCADWARLLRLYFIDRTEFQCSVAISNGDALLISCAFTL